MLLMVCSWILILSRGEGSAPETNVTKSAVIGELEKQTSLLVIFVEVIPLGVQVCRVLSAIVLLPSYYQSFPFLSLSRHSRHRWGT